MGCPNERKPVEVRLRGQDLLGKPLLNKGTAFTERERSEFGLLGLLPPHVESIGAQADRAYEEYRSKDNDLQRHIFLRQLQDENETLFYRLLLNHIEELTPIVYTPVVGQACERFGKIFRRPRGLYVSYPDRFRLDRILANINSEVEIIVVTDGERILGLGDQGAGGMGIPIGKLTLYSLCGGIDPATTLPVLLDVGTDNEARLHDPRYHGWRHRRIRGPEYEAFVERFVQAVMRRFPAVTLQWEDFASTNAEPLLERYRNRLCTFNDDIQGTAAVITGTVMSALAAKGEAIEDQVFLTVGAGSAGFGASQLLLLALKSRGLSEAEARRRLLVTDSKGLLFEGRDGMTPLKKSIQQRAETAAPWIDGQGRVPLATVIEKAHPTVLIGATGHANTFTKEMIQALSSHCEMPTILPLSNPTSKAEATPADLLKWTGGRALVATGSPFPPVAVDGRERSIAQCNNIYIFPALGLGIRAVNARRVTDGMFMACAVALSELSPALSDHEASLLPPLTEIRTTARYIAKAVAHQAMREGVADLVTDVELDERIDCAMWEPRYRTYIPS